MRTCVKYFNRPSKIPKPDKSDLYRYIAVFERFGLLIKWKLLKPKNVDMLYGHRFEKLISYGKERFEADFGGFPPPSSSPGVGWIHCPLARFGETPKCR
jgi:hypothetical protein